MPSHVILYAFFLLAAVDAREITPECGKVVTNGNELVLNGSKIISGRFPWHVDIYKRNSTASYSRPNSGTLIRPNLVISVAYELVGETVKEINASDYTIKAGKYRHQYSNGTPAFYTQKSAVKQIVIVDRYEGVHNYYVHNVALIYLESPFKLTTLVSPICIDWSGMTEKSLMKMGKMDKVVGWFNTASTNSGNQTNSVTLSYIRQAECRSRVRERVKPYVTNDTFCVDCSSGLDGCRKTAPLVAVGYKYDGRWYLLGLRQVNHFPASHQREWVVMFNKVRNYRRWIHADDSSWSIGSVL